MVMVDTLKNVIVSCVIDKIDPDALATFDLEYMFTQIRAKSVGETIDLLFPCDEDHGEQNEKARVKIIIDLSSLKVEAEAGHSTKIDLFGDVGVVMRYPTIDAMKKLESVDGDDIDGIFEVIADSIDYIYQGEELFYGKEQPRGELIQFLNHLSSEQFIKVQNFFTTMPKIKKEVEYNCPICGKHHKKTLEGLQSFF
jgi:hypothetical protein